MPLKGKGVVRENGWSLVVLSEPEWVVTGGHMKIKGLRAFHTLGP